MLCRRIGSKWLNVLKTPECSWWHIAYNLRKIDGLKKSLNIKFLADSNDSFNEWKLKSCSFERNPIIIYYILEFQLEQRQHLSPPIVILARVVRKIYRLLKSDVTKRHLAYWSYYQKRQLLEYLEVYVCKMRFFSIYIYTIPREWGQWGCSFMKVHDGSVHLLTRAQKYKTYSYRNTHTHTHRSKTQKVGPQSKTRKVRPYLSCG